MSAWIDNAKSIVSIVRDGLITLVLILLLLVPGAVNQRLVSAGFVHGNIAGFEWQAAVKENNQKLGDAADTINTLQDQLRKTEVALQATEQSRQKLAAQVAATAPDSSAAKAAATEPAVPTSQIVQQNNQLVQRSHVYAETLRQQMRANEQLLATVPSR